MRAFKQSLFITLVTASLIACDGNDDNGPIDVVIDAETDPAATPGVGNSVYDNIVNNNDLSILRSVIDAVGLANILDNEENEFTVFAPTDDAFRTFAQSNPDLDLLTALESDPSSLTAALTPIVNNHVLSNVLGINELSEFGFGVNVGDVIGVDDLGIPIIADADDVATPSEQTISGEPVFLSASFTAPTGVEINNVDVVIGNSNFDPDTSIGVVHIIESVLIRTVGGNDPIEGGNVIDAETNPAATPGVGNSVYDNIVNNSDLSILRSAIDAVGLANKLDNEENAFTVFAPTNAAFTSFAQSNPDLNLLTALISDPSSVTGVLSPILTNHVLPDVLGIMELSGVDFGINIGDPIEVIDPVTGLPTLATADDVVTPSIQTITGEPVFLSPSFTAPTGVEINNVDVVIGDSNFDPDTSIGVVHIIESVLIRTIGGND